jgi:hypothetical protein
LGGQKRSQNLAEAVEAFTESKVRLEFQLQRRHRDIPDEVTTPEVSLSTVLRMGYIDGRPNPILV